MASHVGRLRASVIFGVGAAFDIHAGTLPQAPLWMQRNGLEWAFRLVKEPRRLAKRYLRNNPGIRLGHRAAATFHARARETAVRRPLSKRLFRREGGRRSVGDGPGDMTDRRADVGG